MKVYKENMSERICAMRTRYYEENGEYPTHIEMTTVEYNLLKQQINNKYGLMSQTFDSNEKENSRTIIGMIVVITKE